MLPGREDLQGVKVMGWFYHVLFIVLSIACGYFVFQGVRYYWQSYRQGKKILQDKVDEQSIVIMLIFLIMGTCFFLAGIGVYNPMIKP